MNTVTRGCHCSQLKQSGTTFLHANEHHCAWFRLLELKRSGTRLLQTNEHCYAWFTLFGAETKWKKFVTCEWTTLHVGRPVWSSNEVQLANCMGMDTVMLGSNCWS